MLTKNHIQKIRELHTRTGRNSVGLFLVEGRKGIGEFIASDFEIVEGFFTEKFFSTLSFRRETEESLSNLSYVNEVNTFSKIKEKGMPTAGQNISFPYSIVSEKELERLSTLSSNRDGILVVRMRQDSFSGHFEAGGICSDMLEADPSFVRMTKGTKGQQKSGLTLILDGINDPGNLGTIIRIADWYGVTHIVASQDTVDCYNPKVIIATMGSFTRVSISYHDLESYLGNIKESKIYGAYLDGENIRTKKYTPDGGYLVIGSESHGIRPSLEKYITDKITIPRVGLAESLNAGVATGIILERMIGK